VTERTRAFLGLTFGAVLVRTARTNALLRYVRPGARALVIAAAIAVLALATWRLFRLAGHAGAPASTRAGWLLLAPVIVLVAMPPPGLGVADAQRVPAALRRPTAEPPVLPRADPVTLNLSELVTRAVWNAGSSLRGRRLRFIGFVRRFTPDGFVLTRLSITCCAADAEADNVDIRTSGTVLSPGSWVEVTGRFVGMSSADRFTPCVVGDAVRPASAPADPYD
jgi:uncharacterized repeat protein (TIGR03943 family)